VIFVRGPPTTIFSVRIFEKLYQTGELLKSRHPHSINHSYIYALGLRTIIADLTEKGEKIPDDPVSELIELKQNEIDDLSADVEELLKIRNKQNTLASRTLAGTDGCKPGYRMVNSTDERGRPIRIAVEVKSDE